MSSHSKTHILGGEIFSDLQWVPLEEEGVPLIILGRDLRISLKKPAAWAKTLGWPSQYPGPREEKGRSNMARSARRLPSPDAH